MRCRSRLDTRTGGRDHAKRHRVQGGSHAGDETTSTSLVTVRGTGVFRASRPLVDNSGCYPSVRLRRPPKRRRTGTQPRTGKSGCAAARGRRKERAVRARRPRETGTYYEKTAPTPQRRVSRQGARWTSTRHAGTLALVVHDALRDQLSLA